MVSRSRIIPILRYRDPRRAIAWLGRAFGFSVHFVAEEEGAILHAQLRLGEDLVFLGPDHPDDRYGMHSPLALNGTNQCVYISSDEDIDGLCRKAREAGATIVTDPYDTPYGAREYSCRDLEGHVWTVGSYRGE
jgi:uncharacterized glyoxalase superfamily protein PhnB